MVNFLDKIAKRLIFSLKESEFNGYDPYDALNSRLFQLLPFLDFKIPRLVMIQLLKRTPINVRKLLLIPKTQNPKALALFLSASIKLFTLGLQRKEVIIDLIDIKLMNNKAFEIGSFFGFFCIFSKKFVGQAHT